MLKMNHQCPIFARTDSSWLYAAISFRYDLNIKCSLFRILQNLTEFNTAHNRRISMLGIPDDEKQRKKRKKLYVTFNEEDEVINPEDIDPTIGRFRNLVQSTVIPSSKKVSRIRKNILKYYPHFGIGKPYI